MTLPDAKCTYAKHYHYVEGAIDPVHSLLTSSEDDHTSSAAETTPDEGTTTKVNPDSEEDRQQRGVTKIVGEGIEVEEEAKAIPDLSNRKRKHSELPVRQLVKADNNPVGKRSPQGMKYS